MRGLVRCVEQGWIKMKPKTKFKKGDKVRILPSAVDISVAEDEVGKTGVITYYASPKNIIVFMDKIRKESYRRVSWNVYSSQIELVVVKGQQLLLWNDILE